MRKIQTEILVIGGGATGAGTLRDLAMRGFKCVLVEKGDLTHGTTGRYHGLLHSGGRYVVKDPQAAVECIEENRILRRIMPHCIEDTGGFFVLTPWDDPEYAPLFFAGCKTAGIPVEEVTITQMVREEPLINPKISACFRVPDASADSFLATDMNAESARQYGARVFTYHKVTQLVCIENRVTGAVCHDLEKDELVQIDADLVVNASGAWAGQLAAMAGLTVHVVPGKGVMIAMNHRIVNTVINRCKMPSDGDILVPAHTVSVIGTTDVKVEHPDHFAIEPWEVQLMLEEGEKIIPGFKSMRMLRAWAGVRPLYQETAVSDTRDVTRAYVLLDHTSRDGVDGMVTITSGKWTTYRQMAQATADLVCKKLGTRRPCKTHLEALPNRQSHKGYHYLGARLAHIESDHAYGDLVCECELALRSDIERAITQGEAKTLDDIRRDARLGMGPCQGGFCTLRVAGIKHSITRTGIQSTNVSLRDFLQERWKGLAPILWGQQLRQERLDELIYLSVLNANHLPGAGASRLGPESYSPPAGKQESAFTPAPSVPVRVERKPDANLDALIVGAGLAGLVTAIQASLRGKRVRLITKGWGALYWHAGCIDLLGYAPPDYSQIIESPADALVQLVKSSPAHPYAIAGLGAVEQAVLDFQFICAQNGYPMLGSIDQNWLLPSALGTVRPTCLAPITMIAGDLRQKSAMLLVGFEQFQDFFPGLAADNLNAQGFSASSILLNLPSLRERTFVTGRVLAEAFETSEFQSDVIKGIKSALGRLDPLPDRIGFPAVLGLQRSLEVKRALEEQLGLPVFEIPTLPPSIPGIRLSRMLVAAIEQAGGRVFEGMQAVSIEVREGENSTSVDTILSEAAARKKPHRARKFVLATGGILGGGLFASYEGHVSESVCNIPIDAPPSRQEWLNTEFLSSRPQPIFSCGITVNTDFQPVNPDRQTLKTGKGNPLYSNLYAVGTILAGGDYLLERSYDGVALVSGTLAESRI